MRTLFFRLSTLFCLLLFGLSSCKKTEDTTVTPTPTPVTKSSAKSVLTFSFAALSPAVNGTIDNTAKTISATVPSGTDLTKLVPTITLSDKATVSPASGVAQDFSKAVTYTVTAEDGSTQAYLVTVVAAISTTSNGTWTQKKGFPNDSISSGKPVAMVFGDKVVVGFGAKFPTLSKAIWEYTASTDVWVRKANFPGDARFGVSSFVINGKGYVVGGSAQSFGKYSTNSGNMIRLLINGHQNRPTLKVADLCMARRAWSIIKDMRERE